MSSHPAYRPDIDGLRAIAILSVLGFHAFPDIVKGGFVGVDIFFVISGFLISSIIIGDLQGGRFSFKTFYMRRIRRLFPALIVVLSTTLAVGWLFMLPEEFAQLGKHVAAGMGFVANFVFLDETGYFDKEALAKPLLHIWSLGVEEQFYIVWPIILLAAWKWQKRLLPVLAVIFVASFAYNVIEAYDNRDKAFFLPHARFWELLAGAALAYGWVSVRQFFDRPRQNGRGMAFNRLSYADIASVAGFGLIALSLYALHEELVFPGWVALAPVAGAVLLISAPQAFVNRRILSHPVMVWIGLISYPLYLWHWPVLSYMRILDIDQSFLSACAALGVSILLAWLTYRFIEKPVRARAEKTFIIPLGVLAALMICAGLAISKDWVKPYLNIAEINRLMESFHDWKSPPPGTDKKEFQGERCYTMTSEVPEEVVYLGDSNMQHFLPRVAHLVSQMPDKTYSATFFTSGGCRPLPNVTKRRNEKCFRMMDAVTAYIKGRYTVKRLVISGRWHGAIHSGESIQYRMPDGAYISLTDEKMRDKAMDDFAQFIRDIKAQGVDVYIVQNVPSDIDGMDQPVLNRTSLAWLKFKGNDTPYQHPQTFLREDGVDMKAREIIAAVARQSGARIIDPVPSLCGAETCPLFYGEDGKAIYKDTAHLTYSYARDHADFMDETILKAPER